VASWAAAPYVLPFAVFMFFLAIERFSPLPPAWDFGVRIVAVGGVLAVLSRRQIDLKMSRPLWTAAVGIGVFVLWIAPDCLFPGYRNFWLFNNGLVGSARTSLSEAARNDELLLALRLARAVIIVPVVEELFWRGFLMRWLISSQFEKIPPGTYTPVAFWVTAVLFASEHGPYWDVGLLAGIVYNWWMVRTRRLGDLIWAHAITNACLSAYVMIFHRWEYWL
jgi:CAAX prenyl protease-like protein